MRVASVRWAGWACSRTCDSHEAESLDVSSYMDVVGVQRVLALVGTSTASWACLRMALVDWLQRPTGTESMGRKREQPDEHDNYPCLPTSCSNPLRESAPRRCPGHPSAQRGRGSRRGAARQRRATVARPCPRHMNSCRTCSYVQPTLPVEPTEGRPRLFGMALWRAVGGGLNPDRGPECRTRRNTWILRC